MEPDVIENISIWNEEAGDQSIPKPNDTHKDKVKIQREKKNQEFDSNTEGDVIL